MAAPLPADPGTGLQFGLGEEEEWEELFQATLQPQH